MSTIDHSEQKIKKPAEAGFKARVDVADIWWGGAVPVQFHLV